MSTLQGRVELDSTRQALEQVGLLHVAEHLPRLLDEAVKEQLAGHRFLDKLLNLELTAREERRIQAALRRSGLPPGLTLGNFDFAFQPSLERHRIETLATCSWIRDKETVLLQGAPGVGKTHLATALGVKAVSQGFSVAFYPLEDLLSALKADTDAAPRRWRCRKCVKVSLLIIDEMGYQPLNRAEASLFFRLVSYRYQRGSVLITTNKAVKDWPEVLAGDEVMATALLDRLLHRCHVVNIKGPSYRLRDLAKLLK